MRSLLLGILTTFSWAANASVVTIEFSGSYSGGPAFTTLQEQGYEFYSAAGFVGTGYATYCPDCSATMTNIAGNPFSLLSFDIGNPQFPGTGNALLTVTGYYVGGGQISRQITAIAGSGINFANYQFDSAWSNLQRVDFGRSSNFTALALDNVVVSTVPVPAAVWLFVSALAGLGWLRRMQTAWPAWCRR